MSGGTRLALLGSGPREPAEAEQHSGPRPLGHSILQQCPKLGHGMGATRGLQVPEMGSVPGLEYPYLPGLGSRGQAPCQVPGEEQPHRPSVPASVAGEVTIGSQRMLLS